MTLLKIQLSTKYLIVLVLFSLLLPIGVRAEFSPGETLSVVVRATKLRKEASHWSGVVIDLTYGAAVRFVAQKGEWVEIEADNAGRGFVHTSALTARRVVLLSGNSTAESGTVATDVVLAGKGFNSDVEDLYQGETEGLDMSQIDRWEKQLVSDSDLERFLKEGDLLQ